MSCTYSTPCGNCFDCNIGGCQACYYDVCSTHDDNQPQYGTGCHACEVDNCNNPNHPR